MADDDLVVDTVDGSPNKLEPSILTLDDDALVVDAVPEVFFTPGGARITPYSLEDVPTRQVDQETIDVVNRAAIESQFAEDVAGAMDMGTGRPDDFTPLTVEPDIGKGQLLTDQPFKSDVELESLERNRVENLIIDQYGGKDYQGADAVGPIKVGVREGLARRNKFEDRRGYFKKHYPEGRYLRIDVGGGKTVELYSVVPNGALYRADPTFNPEAPGAGKEFLADLLEVEANVVTPTNVAALTAAIIFPPSILGSAAVGGSAAAANIFEQWAVNETGRSFYDVMTDPSALKDAAIIGSLEATINKVAPGVGARIRAMFGDSGKTALLAGKTTPESIVGQEAAERLGLPLLTVSQLTDSPIIKRIQGQVAGLSKTPQQVFNNQQSKLWQLLDQKAKSPDGLEGFTAAELRQYLDLSARRLSTELDDLYKLRAEGANVDTKTLQKTQEDIRMLTGQLDKSLREVTDQAYTRAFETAEAENVVFDLAPVKEVAQDIRVGTQTRAGTTEATTETIETGVLGPDGKPITRTVTTPAKEVTETIESVDQRLLSIADKFENVWNQEVTTLSVRDKGKDYSFNALKQLQAMRNEVSDIAFGGGQTNQNAVKLLKSIDEVLQNPKGGGAGWKEAWEEATSLSKLASDVKNASKLHTFFARNTQVNPAELGQKFWSGEFNSSDWNVMNNWLISSSKTPAGRDAAKQLLRDVQNGFVQDLASKPDLIAQRIRTIKENDPELFLKLVPNAADRAIIEDIAQRSAWLNSDAVVTALARDMSNGARTKTLLSNMTDAEALKFIEANGGFMGNAALNMRASVFDDILKKATSYSTDLGAETINPTILAREIQSLMKFEGQYAGLEPLFKNAAQPQYMQELADIRTYVMYSNQLDDLGSSLQSASVVAELQGLELSALKQVLQANLMAKFLASPVSVKQMKDVHSKKSFKIGKDSVYGILLDDIRKGFVDQSETLEEETLRTRTAPSMGDVSAVATEPTTDVASAPPAPAKPPMPVPSLNIGNTPLASAPPAPAQSTTDYASLFPRDELGGAIANRKQGIMGLT